MSSRGAPRGRGAVRGGGFGSARGGSARGSSRGGSRGGARGGRGGARGGRGGAGAAKPKAAKVIIEKHRLDGVFIAKGGKDDALVTRNLDPGHSVYGEKRISVEIADGTKVEYRVWNPFRSKIASSIVGGLENTYIKPGSKVLYLGAANGTTVSHVSDVVGPEGTVYAVEFSHRSGRDLVNMAKRRTNVIPIVEDARYPLRYRMLIPELVDVVFADVAQPDQARIVAINAQHFLKSGGNFLISIKASCIDSTAQDEAVFASEIKKLQSMHFKPAEYVTLEPFERSHAMTCGTYLPVPSAGAATVTMEDEAPAAATEVKTEVKQEKAAKSKSSKKEKK